MRSTLTTFDNPYNPFTNFEDWWRFDVEHGYNTCGLIARVARTSEGLTDEEEDFIIEAAIDDILRLDLTGNYEKVYEEDFDGKPVRSLI